MTMQTLTGQPLRFQALPYDRGWPGAWNTLFTSGNIGTMDAATEKVAFIGRIWICDRSASKTFSSAGGKIHFKAGASTVFSAAAGATTLDVGFQDTTQASAFKQPDGTYDTKGTLVSATDTITSSAINTCTMSTGTKTITDLMNASIVFDMTARGGSDLVKIAAAIAPAIRGNNPGSAENVGAGWTFVTASASDVLIEFDDGTFGVFLGGMWLPAAESTHATVTSSTNPDEYGMRFTVPFKCTLFGCEFPVEPKAGTVATGTQAVMRLMSGAAASPTLILADNLDGFENWASSSATIDRIVWNMSSPQTLTPGTVYYLSFRSSSTQQFTFHYLTYPAAGQLAWLPHGTGGYKVSRDGDATGTGALTEVTTHLLPVTLLISQLDDGAGGGGGMLYVPNLAGT